MLKRKSFKLILFGFAFFMSTVVCELTATEVLDEPIRIQRFATREAQQTETSVAATKTALVITPTITPTATPTIVPVSLPAIFIISDPSDDANFCGEHSQADDPPVEILSASFYQPKSFGSDWDGWIVRVELGAPANNTFANDYMFTLKVEIEVAGESDYHTMLIETNAGEHRMGVCSDPTCQNMLPGTGDLAYTDQDGYAWFLAPRDILRMTITSTHLSELGQPTLCDEIEWFYFNPTGGP